MKLNDVLKQECIEIGAKFEDKTEVLSTIARLAKNCSLLEDVEEKEILAGLKEREALGSTGFGKGIAIPHCRLKSVPDFVVGIITVPEGIEFDALDNEKVNLIIFIIAPESKANKQIKLLSTISQTLSVEGATQSVLAESAAENMRQKFLDYTHVDIVPKEQKHKSIINIFVQEEDIFHELLQVLTGIESSQLMVMEAENTGVYLSKIPLFAGLWSDKPRSFSRVIVAIVDTGLTNETIRRIESVTGDLDSCVGVMVAVNDISYSAGSLG